MNRYVLPDPGHSRGDNFEEISKKRKNTVVRIVVPQSAKEITILINGLKIEWKENPDVKLTKITPDLSDLSVLQLPFRGLSKYRKEKILCWLYDFVKSPATIGQFLEQYKACKDQKVHMSLNQYDKKALEIVRQEIETELVLDLDIE
jgi:hypothetical protein